jgi:geranylgeranyl reductase
MIRRTSALVIGGGPAGSTAARFLAEAGVDTVLVERDFSYVKPCGGAIPSGGFREFGLPETLIRNKAGRIIIVSPAGHEIEIGLQGGHLFIVERGHFDSSLRRIAADKGASLIEGDFAGFEKNSAPFISRIRNKETNSIMRVQADYVLASDGITFGVGKSFSIRRPRRLYTISSHMNTHSSDCCEFWFGNNHASNFYSWVFPSGSRTSIGTGGNAPRELSGLLDNFARRRFGRSLQHLLTDNLIDVARIFPVPAWRGRPYTVRNLLLLGDAAGMVMPTTYEGIYYAMKSGQFAAAAVAEKRPEIFQKLLEDRFRYRFLLMNIFRRLFFRSDKTIEKWIRIHGSSVVQEIAMKLWLQKDPGSQNLYAYLKAFGSRVMS